MTYYSPGFSTADGARQSPSHRPSPLDSAHDSKTPVTLRDLFVQQCRRHAPALAFAVLADDLSITAQVTFGDLELQVTALAQTLSQRARPGDRVLLALDNGLDSVELFWACIVAGLVPIPAPAPDPRQYNDAGASRLQGIAADSRAAMVVAAASHLEALSPAPPRSWVSRESLAQVAETEPASPLPELTTTGDDLAYLQYTSGSTSAPRGVELTHKAVLAHYASLGIATETGAPHKSVLNWLPWFHDFGLLQGVVSPIYLGMPCYLLPTITFMRHPLRWPDAIARYRVTYSGGPDMAYLACVRALARKPAWSADLTSWAVATCGAEPVRPDTLHAFTDAFAPHGFRPETFSPAYGLAESVLAVSIKRFGETPRVLRVEADALDLNRVRDLPENSPLPARNVVSCGKPLDGLEVIIVDPDCLAPCDAGTVGEIWVRGPSLGRGYWGQPELTEATFRASPAGSDRQDYLRTGDLGFIHGAEIFVTGRLKDLIIVNGRNLYPQDIELTAQRAHPAVREAGVIAVLVERPGCGGIVILAECTVRPEPAEVSDLVRNIKRKVGATHGIDVHEVVPLYRGTLPRTSSGKPQRQAARKRFLEEGFASERLRANEPPVLPPAPRDVTERTVADAWMSVLGLESCDIEANFFSQGGNSLVATQLVSRLKAATGVDLPIRAVFESPTIAGLAEDLRGRQHATSPPMAPPPTTPPQISVLAGETASRDESASELSFSQERMWFMQQQAPQSTAYHMPLALRFQGPLNKPALEAAFARIVERHDILRTTFESTSTGIAARVHPDRTIEVQYNPPAGQISGPSDPALEQHLARLTQEPFDLAHGPLIKVHVIELAPGDTVVLIVKHHIVGDQWSFAVLARELAHFYRAGLGLETEPLPPLPLQYAAYAGWQRHAFETERRAGEEAFWRAQLSGLEPLALASDHVRPQRHFYRGARVRLPLDPDLIVDLTALGARHAASLSMVMIAALKALLHRYTGVSDISIGVPIANRHHAVSETLIGSFVNMLVFRTEVDRDLDFTQLVERVRQTSLDAYAHQDMPFELLVQTLKLERDASRAPLVQVLFNMVNTPVGKLDFGGLSLSRIDFDREATQFELAVMVDAEHDLSIGFEYATELFRPDTIERLSAHYLRLLREVVRTQDAPLTQWPLLDDAETARALTLGRGRELTLKAETIPDWLRPAFETHADKTAIVFEDRSVSYRDLDRNSEALARALRRRGIGRGHRVGLYVTRSVELLAAQLGILKSGAAYVALDPINPPSRLAYMARDSGLSLILVHLTQGEPLPWAAEWPTLDVTEAVAGTTAREAASGFTGASELDAQPDDPAFIIYTSGSTGEPKGVMVSHASTVNVLSSVQIEPGFTASDRILAISTLSFDISVAETLLPLATGASIVLASSQDTGDGAALRRLIEAHGPSVVQATPSTWFMLLEAGWNGSPSIKKAFVTGEPLPVELATALCARCPEVWNLYGPTETTVWSTLGRVEQPETRGIDIGHAIANTQIHILDAGLRLCPIGVAGELCIGGKGVSLGYLNRPDLTAERFIPDPFSPDRPGARLYRTGDLARWRHDGTLEHLGRSDFQVKLRGYRIELAEIETALARHPDVARAVAVVREIAPGDRRLVAFVVPRAEVSRGMIPSNEPRPSEPPDGQVLRDHLRQHLPAYMVPQHYVMIDALPLLASGKIDRKSLPAFTPAANAARPPVAPRTPAERAMWEIWHDVLGVEGFGVHDNFFDLGGYSMLAVRLVNRINTDLDPSYTLPMLFQDPTISALCAAVEVTSPPETASLVALQKQAEGPALFCICGIQIYQRLADHLAAQAPVYAAFVPCETAILNGEADPHSHFISVEALAAEYLEAIQQKQPHGPYYLAGLSFGGLLAFEIAHQLRRKGEEVALLAMFDTILPESLFKIAVRHAVRQVRVLRENGLADGIARGRQRLWRLVAPVQEPEDDRPAMSDPADSHDDSLAALRDTIYRRAMLRYSAEPYDGTAVLIRADDSKTPDTTPGWCRLIPGLDVVRVPGDHLGILLEPSVGIVARHLLDRLSRRPSNANAGTARNLR